MNRPVLPRYASGCHSQKAAGQTLTTARFFVRLSLLRIPTVLMKSIARVLVKYAGNFVGAGIAGDAIVDIWKIWDQYSQDAQQKRKEVEQLASQPSVEAHRQIVEVVAQEAAGQPET